MTRPAAAADSHPIVDQHAAPLKSMWQLPAAWRLFRILSRPLSISPPSPIALEQALNNPLENVQLIANIHGRLLGIAAGKSAEARWIPAVARFVRTFPGTFGPILGEGPTIHALDHPTPAKHHREHASTQDDQHQSTNPHPIIHNRKRNRAGQELLREPEISERRDEARTPVVEEGNADSASIMQEHCSTRIAQIASSPGPVDRIIDSTDGEEPVDDSQKPIHVFSSVEQYADLPSATRLLLFHAIAELVLCEHDTLLFAGSINDIDVHDLRLEPLGTDSLGSIYWYFGDELTIYREPNERALRAREKQLEEEAVREAKRVKKAASDERRIDREKRRTVHDHTQAEKWAPRVAAMRTTRASFAKEQELLGETTPELHSEQSQDTDANLASKVAAGSKESAADSHDVIRKVRRKVDKPGEARDAKISDDPSNKVEDSGRDVHRRSSRGRNSNRDMQPETLRGHKNSPSLQSQTPPRSHTSPLPSKRKRVSEDTCSQTPQILNLHEEATSTKLRSNFPGSDNAIEPRRSTRSVHARQNTIESCNAAKSDPPYPASISKSPAKQKQNGHADTSLRHCMNWEVVSAGPEELRSLLDRFGPVRGISHPAERALVKRLQNELLPIIEEAYQRIKKEEDKRMRAEWLANNLKKSSRVSALEQRRELEQARAAAKAAEEAEREKLAAEREARITAAVERLEKDIIRELRLARRQFEHDNEHNGKAAAGNAKALSRDQRVRRRSSTDIHLPVQKEYNNEKFLEDSDDGRSMNLSSVNPQVKLPSVVNVAPDAENVTLKTEPTADKLPDQRNLRIPSAQSVLSPILESANPIGHSECNPVPNTRICQDSVENGEPERTVEPAVCLSQRTRKSTAAFEDAIPRELTWTVIPDDGLPTRALTSFMFVRSSDLTLAPLEEVTIKNEVDFTNTGSIFGFGVVIPPPLSDVSPARIELGEILEWVIEYGSEPRQWIRTSFAWYELKQPLNDYSKTFSTALRKFEICVRLRILGQTMRGDQLSYENIVELLGLRYLHMRSYKESDILEEAPFILEQVQLSGKAGLLKCGFVRHLQKRQREYIKNQEKESLKLARRQEQCHPLKVQPREKTPLVTDKTGNPTKSTQNVAVRKQIRAESSRPKAIIELVNIGGSDAADPKTGTMSQPGPRTNDTDIGVLTANVVAPDLVPHRDGLTYPTPKLEEKVANGRLTKPSRLNSNVSSFAITSVPLPNDPVMPKNVNDCNDVDFAETNSVIKVEVAASDQ